MSKHWREVDKRHLHPDGSCTHVRAGFVGDQFVRNCRTVIVEHSQPTLTGWRVWRMVRWEIGPGRCRLVEEITRSRQPHPDDRWA